MSNATAPSRALPLSGVRVFDIATMLAAPFAATILGEFGADVIKLEMPGKGDGFRRFGKSTEAGSYNWLSENRNKKSITLDLRKPDGVALFKRLVTRADVVIENFRPGTLEKWGLGYDVLKEIKPELVLVRVTAFGQTGPNRDRPGFARSAHAFSGFAALTGEADGGPLMPGAMSLGDYVGGLYAAIGALLALTSKTSLGIGQSVDVCMYEGLFRLMDEVVPVYGKTGHMRKRMGAEVDNVVPHSNYRCQDGKWVALSCSTDDMFERLARVMERPELMQEGQFGTMSQRLARRAELNDIVAGWIEAYPRDEVLRRGYAGGVALAEVLDVADIFADPHYQARSSLVEVPDSRVGSLVLPNVFPNLSETPGEIRCLGPDLGSHNNEIYVGELGLTGAELDDLKQRGVV